MVEIIYLTLDSDNLSFTCSFFLSAPIRTTPLGRSPPVRNELDWYLVPDPDPVLVLVPVPLPLLSFSYYFLDYPAIITTTNKWLNTPLQKHHIRCEAVLSLSEKDTLSQVAFLRTQFKI
jgi:hypothetical protein